MRSNTIGWQGDEETISDWSEEETRSWRPRVGAGWLGGGGPIGGCPWPRLSACFCGHPARGTPSTSMYRYTSSAEYPCDISPVQYRYGTVTSSVTNIEISPGRRQGKFEYPKGILNFGGFAKILSTNFSAVWFPFFSSRNILRMSKNSRVRYTELHTYVLLVPVPTAIYCSTYVVR